MPTGLLSNLEMRGAADEPEETRSQAGERREAESTDGKADLASQPPAAPPLIQPAYLARIATLPSTLPANLHERNEAAQQESQRAIDRPQGARLDQIEHALTILASVVARLAKEAQQSRIQLRSTEHDPGLQEERRVQRELVRSMQARLNHMEERFDRERQTRLEEQPLAALAPPEVADQLAQSLHSIRDSLAALAKRRPRQNPA